MSECLSIEWEGREPATRCEEGIEAGGGGRDPDGAILTRYCLPGGSGEEREEREGVETREGDNNHLGSSTRDRSLLLAQSTSGLLTAHPETLRVHLRLAPVSIHPFPPFHLSSPELSTLPTPSTDLGTVPGGLLGGAKVYARDRRASGGRGAASDGPPLHRVPSPFAPLPPR